MCVLAGAQTQRKGLQILNPFIHATSTVVHEERADATTRVASTPKRFRIKTIGQRMKQIKGISSGLPWLMAIGLTGLVSACGGGGQAPILGAGDISPVIPPTVTSVSPLPNAQSVAINTKVITANFSVPMDTSTLTASSFTVACAAEPAITGATVTPLAANKTFTLNLPAANLPSNASCVATVTTAAKDSTGLALANNFEWRFTTSAVADTSKPTVTNTINADGATGVAVNTKVGATFSETMDPATINTSFSVKQTLSGSAVPGTTTYSGVNAVFVPTSALATNTQYTATITTAAKDIAGNSLTGTKVWSWTTAQAADTTKPRVTDTINEPGAINVPTNTRVGATFSEALDPATVTNATFTLKQKSNGAAVSGTTSYSGVDAVFIPLVNLLPNTEYTATVKSGANGVEDLASNAMAADYSWSWTTAAVADITPPLVVLVNPADRLEPGVPVTASVNATFNEAMDPLTINTANFTLQKGAADISGTVSYNAVTKIATFKPDVNLLANTEYTATVINDVTDLAGNPLALAKVWTFKTNEALVILPIIALNTAKPYGTFGGTAGMTNMGTLTQINGDIGTIATATGSITGFHDTLGDIYTETGSNKGAVNGKIFTCTTSTTGPTSAVVNPPACAAATQARLDAQTAYLALVATPVTTEADGASPAPGANLASLTLLPGTYKSASGSFMIQGGNLTLDAQGDANATWIFQMSTTLTVGGPGAAFPQSIVLAGGAQAKNVFWQVGSFATINAAGGGTMVGTIIAQEGASFSTAGNVNKVTLNGRALSLGASVTLVNTVINVPGQ